ncbi:Coiled-coil domain-containing protein 93 [Camelus dromedarius]|uniref:Coiled-coil domain-containing protein 93 n=1 Tax=Camelus dromedarius TaxID=9838 RepID=A0A5N4DW72_CAMDR|nr:Coiled-coil domain-containing protein 93 [Camelus dromedarius]
MITLLWLLIAEKPLIVFIFALYHMYEEREMKAHAHEEDKLQDAEEQRVQSVKTKMTAVANEGSRLTASSVGQIVGVCSAEIRRLKLKAKRAPGGGEETLSGGELRGALAPETTHDEDLDRQHNTEKGKLYKIRILQARRNQERAILPRKTDEVPSRAELIQ